MDMPFSEILKRFKTDFALTQKQMADKLGMSDKCMCIMKRNL